MTCDHGHVTDYDKERQDAALAELDTLTTAFKAAEAQLKQAREALQEGIVRHLRERNAPPGKIAEHSPYDRNHIGRIREAHKIPALRTPTVKPIKPSESESAVVPSNTPSVVPFMSASDRHAELIDRARRLPPGRYVELVSWLEEHHWGWLRTNRKRNESDWDVVQKAIKAGLLTTSQLV